MVCLWMEVEIPGELDEAQSSGGPTDSGWIPHQNCLFSEMPSNFSARFSVLLLLGLLKDFVATEIVFC